MAGKSEKEPNINVLFPIRGGGPYTYLPPEDRPGELTPGVRVVAPLGRRLLTGVVTESGVDAPKGVRLRRAQAMIDERPLVPGSLLGLLGWIADYYFCDRGEALRAMVPGTFLKVGDRMVRLREQSLLSPQDLSSRQKKILLMLENEGEILQSRLTRRVGARSIYRELSEMASMGLVEIDDHLPLLPRARMRTMVEARREVPEPEAVALLERAVRQRECYDYLLGMSAPVELTLLTRLNFSPAVVSALATKGLIHKYEVQDPRDPFRNVEFPDYEVPEPSPAQRGVIERVGASLERHGVWLLHGVTGSGKTLVYMELLRPVLESGRQAIILVPEIALTPQTTGRFRAVFGDRVAVLHSGLSDGERYDIWRGIARGDYSVVVGPRSAVFAPFDRLGIVIIDEEHEHTYKEAEYIPRYHAREVAVRRMREADGPVVLGSATPSLESYQRARDGDYTLIELPDRVQGLPLPEVSIFDLRRGWAANKRSFVTDKLVDEMGFALDSGGQVLLMLNRRGFNNFLICEECGQVVECGHCRISLTFHRRLNRLLCHYCGAQKPLPESCPACASKRMAPMGMGTEQVESLLEERFPDRVIDRMDMDTTGGKWSHHEILERLRTGATDILVGTQMIAKGLDFPDVVLVGVVNADTAMNLPDFRATERTFGLLAQVAGRTGRGSRGGEVVIQTFRPSHPAIRAAVKHDYRSFAAGELEVRRSAGYPPFSGLLNAVFSGRDEKAVEKLAVKTARGLEKMFGDELDGERSCLLGPAPCPLERIRGRYRYHFILRSPDSGLIGRAGRWLARNAVKTSRGGCRMVLDRDPVSLM